MPRKKLFHIEDFDLKDKRVFIRADLNVPLQHGKILDAHRINRVLPTIRHALDRGARVILASHLGRPQGRDPKFSLSPIAQFLSEVLDCDVFLTEELLDDALPALASALKQNQLILLENLRFHPGEAAGSVQLAQQLAPYIDIYINEAFGVCHRRHASLTTLPERIEKKGIGFLIQKEMECLDKIKSSPDRPFTAVLGGAKVKDKFKLILKLMDHADSLVIGGAMAYVFLKVKGCELGTTYVEKESLSLARDLIERMEGRQKKLYLPIDHLIVPEIQKTDQAQASSGVDIPPTWKAVDIGPKTIQYFTKVFSNKVKTIFWNGPMGVFEIEAYSRGTRAVAEAISRCSKAFRIVGGGDSARAVLKYKLPYDHISTGGGSGLAYIQGEKLPGFESLYTVLKEDTASTDDVERV